MKKKVFAGIRATGRLHLGNYFGAVKGMVSLQDTHDCVFCVVDLHTITTPYDPKTLQESILQVAIDYLAAGLDPKKVKLTIQSLVPEHIELAYLLGTIYPVSRLRELPTYKDKVKLHPKYQNMGLLYYPVLMAADILLYKAELVPAGLDQEPHLEVTREIARNFNRMFGEVFPQPIRLTTSGDYVPSLLGTGKMSKSVEGSYINLSDSPDTIRSRVMKAVTDTGPLGRVTELPKEGPIANLFSLFRLFDPSAATPFETAYLDGTLRYSDMKKALAEVVIEGLKPIQEKRKELESNKDEVRRIVAEGSNAARVEAQNVLSEAKKQMGLL